MVQVQSSWFPLFDRNPQTFVDIPRAKPSDYRKATQRVYRTRELPIPTNRCRTDGRDSTNAASPSPPDKLHTRLQSQKRRDHAPLSVEAFRPLQGLLDIGADIVAADAPRKLGLLH